MEKESLQDLGDRIMRLQILIGDFSDMITVIRQIDNDSREQVIDVLVEKIKEYRLEHDSIIDLIKLKQKSLK